MICEIFGEETVMASFKRYDKTKKVKKLFAEIDLEKKSLCQ